jgi:hypothetical protein
MPHKPQKDRDILALLEMKPGYMAFRCVCRTGYLVYLAPEVETEENARRRAKEKRACFVDARELDFFVCRCGFVIFDDAPLDSTFVH